ncbi:MAG: 3-methylornithyl-N6-L-lysine dehydrogenase PylD, partial [Deltaproteobacteria bacterium]|nr:3-methylornithyl-N6-L-lysine dehydrogenase PylD [Deltaproteobacteria bacterium]
MTRLTTDDITSMADQLNAYDEELIGKTGRTLAGIACHAAGIGEAEMLKIAADLRVSVVPITFGQGIIPGFCETVANIVSHIGCRAKVPQLMDVAGLAEAYENKSDILMFADDDRFVAIGVKNGIVVDNAIATAKGFIAGLDLMAGGLKQKNVLVLGCGLVGRAATHTLVQGGAIVSIYDINSECSLYLANEIKEISNAQINIIEELDQALTDHQFIVDATPAAEVIRASHISGQTYISAPGVPLGLDKAAQVKISDRLLHDPLQIGVATML